MSYPLFPTLPGLEFPVKRTLLARSLRQKAISGRETFQPQWSTPLYQYEVSFALLRAASAFQEWQALAGFWNSVMFAPGGVFQFDDPNDDTVANQPTGSGDGSTTQFQLVRSLGGFTEPVLCPVSVALSLNGTPTSAWSFQNGSAAASGGVIVFATAPASGAALTWSGVFHWLCRFDEDSLAFSNFMQSFWELKTCRFTTVRL